MKIRMRILFVLLTVSVFSLNSMHAQIIKQSEITAEKADFQLIAPNSYMLEIGGENNYYWKQELDYTDNISIAALKADGKPFADGSYVLQITPIVKLTDEERKELRTLLSTNNQEQILAFRQAHNLPERVEVTNIYFRILNGKFVSPDQKEGKRMNLPTMSGVWQQDHPAMYASLDQVNIDYGTAMLPGNEIPAIDNTMDDDAQVFTQDVIVQGSICVGLDCTSTESFGFDTQRLKENNLRIHFDDTSNSGSFPSNDWRITINSSDNGGPSFFAIEDATAGRVPFRIEAGAPANALIVDAQGDVGIGTSTPVLELHINDGDTPTMRLQQDGSSGFGSQTWDVAGNETNFFVRDVTNGSELPFKIFPGADDNSLVIDAQNEIGIGVQNPSHRLQVESGNVYVKSGNLGINVEPSVALDVSGVSRFTGTSVFAGDVTYTLNTGASFIGSGFVTALRVDATNNRVGIGTVIPATELEVCGTIAATNTTITNSTTCASDIRFKKNINTLEGTLNKLLQLRGVHYDWKIEEYPTKGFSERHQIGFIAQEMETLFPELVNTEASGYKAVDYAKMTPVLVEAIKEQQELIEAQKEEITALQSELDELKDLKAQVAALSNMVSNLTEVKSEEETNEVQVSAEKE